MQQPQPVFPGYAQAAGQMYGSTHPFVQAMYWPFIQSFQGVGMDPFGQQVREAQGKTREQELAEDLANSEELARRLDAKRQELGLKPGEWSQGEKDAMRWHKL